MNDSKNSFDEPSRSGTPKVREEAALAELDRPDLRLRRRRRLLSELRRVGGGRSVEALRANLYHPDLKSKTGSVLALCEIRTDGAVDALSEFVRVQNGPPFALAVHSLGVAHAQRAMPELIEILERRGRELSQGDKRVVIQALARMPHRSEVPVLSAMLTERSFLTRRVAAMALSSIRAPESRAALREAAKSLSWLAGLPVRREISRSGDESND